MSLVSNLIWFFGVGGVSVAVLAYYFQDYLLYFPGIPPGARTMFLDPAAFMLKNFMREVMLPTHDGQLLQLWLFLRPPEEPGSRDAATIVFFHGNAGSTLSPCRALSLARCNPSLLLQISAIAWTLRVSCSTCCA